MTKKEKKTQEETATNKRNEEDSTCVTALLRSSLSVCLCMPNDDAILLHIPRKPLKDTGPAGRKLAGHR